MLRGAVFWFLVRVMPATPAAETRHARTLPTAKTRHVLRDVNRSVLWRSCTPLGAAVKTAFSCNRLLALSAIFGRSYVGKGKGPGDF